jgi:Glycosyl transferase family 2
MLEYEQAAADEETGTMDIRHAETAMANGDGETLCELLKGSYPHDPDIGRLHDWVCFTLGTADRPDGLTTESSMFADSILQTRQLLKTSGSNSVPCLATRKAIGENLDFLGDGRGLANWTMPQCLNYLSIGRLQPRHRAAVVATACDDGIYILEWIAHYRALGFDAIFIYTNDNSDGSEDLLRQLADHGAITLIESKTSGTVAPEAKAFEHSIQLLHDLRRYEWVLYVDSDEYFWPEVLGGHGVANLLQWLEARCASRSPSAVCYQWLWFTSDMIFEREVGCLLERFQYARPHLMTKSFVRLREVVSMRYQHFPEIKPGGEIVDSAFNSLPLDVREVWDRSRAKADQNMRPEYAGGHIKHYWPRSFEEFFVKKVRAGILKLEDNPYDRPFRLFFAWNGYAAPENHYPVDPQFLRKVKGIIEQLQAIEGVGVLSEKLDKQFPAFLAQLAAGRDLRHIYRESATEPTDF